MLHGHAHLCLCETAASWVFFLTCPPWARAAMAGNKRSRTLDFLVPEPCLLGSGAAGAFARPGPAFTLAGHCRCAAHDPDGFYRVMGVQPSATTEELAAAHRARRSRLHLGFCADDAKDKLGKLGTLLDQARLGLTPEYTRTRAHAHRRCTAAVRERTGLDFTPCAHAYAQHVHRQARNATFVQGGTGRPHCKAGTRTAHAQAGRNLTPHQARTCLFRAAHPGRQHCSTRIHTARAQAGTQLL